LEPGQLDHGSNHGCSRVHYPRCRRQNLATETSGGGIGANMDRIINFEILKHPLNWVTVILMVLIAGIGFHFFLQYQTGSNPASFLNSKSPTS
jgi:hypothetical protein